PDLWLRQNRPERKDAGVAVAEGDAPVVVRAPSLQVHEPYLEILDRDSGQRVVTVIEIVSPGNKYAGPGRSEYERQQGEVIGSKSHLVEIDLLRRGPHVLAVPEELAKAQGAYDYLISVNRARGAREEFELYPRNLRQRLPRIRVPLAEGDPDVLLDLQAVLTH